MLSRTPSPTSSSSSPHPVFSEKAIADDKLQFQASDDKDKDQQVYQNETLKGLQQDDHIRAALTVGKDAAFLIKVDLLNQEISRIGMGRFRGCLFSSYSVSALRPLSLSQFPLFCLPSTSVGIHLPRATDATDR